MEKNVIGWVEIPVADMQRAITFYEAVFGWKLQHSVIGDLEMALFPADAESKPGATGSLVKHAEFYKPCTDGALPYFNSPSGDLDNELNHVEAAGGRVLIFKRQISPEHGFMAVFLDTEGNRVAMHSVA